MLTYLIYLTEMPYSLNFWRINTAKTSQIITTEREIMKVSKYFKKIFCVFLNICMLIAVAPPHRVPTTAPPIKVPAKAKLLMYTDTNREILCS